MMSGVKLEEIIYLDFITRSPTTGAAADADATPTCEVFEDATDTAILSPTVVKRTAKTGNYRIPVACTAANGFEAGKSYNVVASATVGGVADKSVVASFVLRALSVDDATDIAVAVWAGAPATTPLADIAVAVWAGAPATTPLADIAVAVWAAVPPGTPLEDFAAAVWAAAPPGTPLSDIAVAVTGHANFTALVTKVDTVDNLLDTEVPALTAAVGAVGARTALIPDLAATGTVTGTGGTTTSLVGDAGLSSVANFYVGSVLAFTTGALKGCGGRRITAYNNISKSFTFAEPWPAAPANGVTFAILGRIDPSA